MLIAKIENGTLYYREIPKDWVEFDNSGKCCQTIPMPGSIWGYGKTCDKPVKYWVPIYIDGELDCITGRCEMHAKRKFNKRIKIPIDKIERSEK